MAKAFLEMKNSPILRLDLYTDHPDLYELTKTIYTEYLEGLKSSKSSKKDIKGLDFYRTLKILLENFIYSSSGLVSISLSNDFYSKLPKRYNPQLISAYLLRKVINFLVKSERIALHKGFYSGGFSMRTRLEPLPKLCNEIKASGLRKGHITINERMERVILKDRDQEERKIYSDYPDDDISDCIRNFIYQYEKFINQFKFKSKEGRITRINFKRVFNNGNFDEGGRFYSEYQNIKSEIRSTTMTCDGEALKEYDFKGMHINMLYARKGLPYPEGDVYTIAGFEQYRNLFKVALQIALNADSSGSAVLGMNKHLIDNKISLKEINGKLILDAFTKKHAAISDFFFSGIGVRLQYQDSEICQRIMQEAMEKGIPVLPVHDSFLVRERDAEDLIAMMKKYSKEVLGQELSVEGK